MSHIQRSQLAALLAELEADLPGLTRDMDGFFEAFEQRSWQIASRARPEDEAYVWHELETIITRAGING